MEFSTAKWIASILGLLSVITITVYFVLEEKEIMIPAFSASFMTIVTITLLPAVFLLGAMMMAEAKKEDKISGKSLQRALVLIVGLLIFRLLTGYFS
ncbi:hypothetical protein [Sporosarcina sp. FSL K6-1508]|uniref:hypothetical protein n=1 Tax=Sporosarcina sp. FSL K6-1508 TaxID=2921553 RepID=UPI0030F7CB9F